MVVLPTTVARSLDSRAAGDAAVVAKRGLDLLGAVVLLVLVAPLLAALAVAIRVADGAPVLFVQDRVGRDGRRFRMAKLRTMTPGAEEHLEALRDANEVEGPAFKLRADPRVTRLGRWLRRSSLDELPQLWHVLTGEMSLVGPRPALPDEVGDGDAWRRRLAVRPGLTGLWQVSGRAALPWVRWLALDVAYLDGWTLGRDLVILARTLPAVLSGRGAW